MAVYLRPYKKTNPRSVRGARKRGWHVVKVPNSFVERNVSWLGLDIWANINTQGNYIDSFMLREFAFERQEDASWFALKWCV